MTRRRDPGATWLDDAVPEPSSLSLEQKASLLTGRDFWSTQPVEAAGVPAVVLTDGPHGIRKQAGGTDQLDLAASVAATCFPPAVAVGNSWDPKVAEEIGAAVGREARALGVHIALGPGVNIKRSPLCGRNFEYYSEDPLLAGVLGAAHVRGQQAQGVGASLKHFAANNQETDRMRVSAEVDERTLREIYLAAFERIITESAPATVMCSYNKLNGVHTSEHRWLLSEVLRHEWGFTGAVVSDWGAVHDRVAALEAGLDLEMPGTRGVSARQVVEAVRSGRLDEGVVDTAVARVLSLTSLVARPAEPFDAERHHALARRLATGCVVLLKNDGGVLPLGGAGPIAVVGPLATTPRYQGGGSSHINATRVDSPAEAMRILADQHDRTVISAPGYTTDGAGDANALRGAAVAAAGGAEVTVIFAGLVDEDESEGFDRTTLDLPSAQVEVIRAVAAASRRTVVVLAHGGVVSLEGWHDDVDAILDASLLGQAGGGAVAVLLFGLANPSGHLAETIPLRLADTPSYVNFPGEQGHVRYGEGVMVGYRGYATTGRTVRYPFGHGLSYTTFATGDVAAEVTGPDTARVTLTVTNTGARVGRHLVQVYVSTTTGPVRRPARELRAFTLIPLDPGASDAVSIDLDRRAFAYYDIEQPGWVVSPGAYVVAVGENANTMLAEVTITLRGDNLQRRLTMESTVGEWFSHPVIGPTLLADLTVGLSEEQRRSMPLDASTLRLVGSMPMGKAIGLLGSGVPDGLVDQLMARSAGVELA
jgi:beta-glucosidase